MVLPIFQQDVWLTSFWGFDPANWGCLGFTLESDRNRFLRTSPKGALVAIYVTKNKGPENMRGKVVGLLQVNNRRGHLQQFMSGKSWAEKELKSDSRGKWEYAVQAIRAWRIIEEDWKPVEQLFPRTYGGNNSQMIGAQGVLATEQEANQLLGLNVYEVAVYGQISRIDSAVQPFRNVLEPSKAVRPATEPYWVGEVDGPKHLYVLKLSGDISSYLGWSETTVDDRWIVKVGFSKSPTSRRDQIQAAYPEGQYRWEIFYPKEIPTEPPYPDADAAIAGEDAMKKRMIEEGAECLGGEFYLAHESSVHTCWQAGKRAATERAKAHKK